VIEFEKVISLIEKQMRLLDRKSRKCSRDGDHQWSAHYMARVMGLLDARNIILDEAKKGDV
jgi:hypothetical protein